jgi:hypothetical protein
MLLANKLIERHEPLQLLRHMQQRLTAVIQGFSI